MGKITFAYPIRKLVGLPAPETSGQHLFFRNLNSPPLEFKYFCLPEYSKRLCNAGTRAVENEPPLKIISTLNLETSGQHFFSEIQILGRGRVELKQGIKQKNLFQFLNLEKKIKTQVFKTGFF